MTHNTEGWCNGTGYRAELGGVPCNLPQLTDAEDAYVEAAAELHERLEKAVATLKGIPRHNDRIRGKIEGVNLALSYLRETLDVR